MKTLKYIVLTMLLTSIGSVGFSRNIDFSGEIRNRTGETIQVDYDDQKKEVNDGDYLLIEQQSILNTDEDTYFEITFYPPEKEHKSNKIIFSVREDNRQILNYQSFSSLRNSDSSENEMLSMGIKEFGGNQLQVFNGNFMLNKETDKIEGYIEVTK